jgi:hypothetical protein
MVVVDYGQVSPGAEIACAIRVGGNSSLSLYGCAARGQVRVGLGAVE